METESLEQRRRKTLAGYFDYIKADMSQSILLTQEELAGLNPDDRAKLDDVVERKYEVQRRWEEIHGYRTPRSGLGIMSGPTSLPHQFKTFGEQGLRISPHRGEIGS